MNALGHHILAEFYDCDPEILNSASQIEFLMKKAALGSGATIINSVFHTFNPHGVSGVVVIAESHLAIHTWPEYGYAAIDVFTCGDVVDPASAIALLKASLSAGSVTTQQVHRGILKTDKKLSHKPENLQIT